jgi:hypothetical protein
MARPGFAANAAGRWVQKNTIPVRDRPIGLFTQPGSLSVKLEHHDQARFLVCCSIRSRHSVSQAVLGCATAGEHSCSDSSSPRHADKPTTRLSPRRSPPSRRPVLGLEGNFGCGLQGLPCRSRRPAVMPARHGRARCELSGRCARRCSASRRLWFGRGRRLTFRRSAEGRSVRRAGSRLRPSRCSMASCAVCRAYLNHFPKNAVGVAPMAPVAAALHGSLCAVGWGASRLPRAFRAQPRFAHMRLRKRRST